MFVFLICTERSGSNFLTNLMGGHRNISAPPPSHLFRLFATNECNYGDLTNESNWKTLVNDVVENFNAKLGVWNTTVNSDELEKNVLVRKSAALLDYIYRKEAESEGVETIFVKENQTFSFYEYLLESFSDCKFVYMVRDPRDVASSWLTTSTIPGGVEKAIDTWYTDQVGAIEVYDKLPEANKYLIKYEDIVSDTVSYLQKIMVFLNLDYDDSVLEFYNNPRTIANASRIEAWDNLRKPVIKNNFGKYKQNLTEVDIEYIEYRCKGLMDRFGYKTDILEQDDTQTEQVIHKRICELKDNINTGSYYVSEPGEKAIRERRLKAINKVLQRRL